MNARVKERSVKGVLIFVTAFIPTIINREDLLKLVVTLDGRFYLDLSMALLTSIILWSANDRFNEFLNDRLPIGKNLVKRLGIQIFFSLIFTLLVVYGLYIPYSTWIIQVPLSRMISPNADLLVIILLIILINLYYISRNFIKIWKDQGIDPDRNNRNRETDPKKNFILVRSGQKVMPVPYADIAELYLENKITYLVTFGNQQYILNESLNYYDGSLPSHDFFRVNRQHLVNRHNIASFRSIENGKLDVQIVTGGKNILASQKTASHFRAWFRGNSGTKTKPAD